MLTGKSSKFLERLNPLPHFNKTSAVQLGEEINLDNNTINVYIGRFLKYKKIFRLKKGLYISNDFFNKNKNNASYLFYLANIIRTPSYISSWTALQYYGLTTETIYPFISITSKKTKKYQNKAGSYLYHSIQEDLFSDFSFVNKENFNFFIASPSKALFDLLYFKTHRFRGLSFKKVKMLIEDLRIDFSEMDKIEQDKFKEMVKQIINN